MIKKGIGVITRLSLLGVLCLFGCSGGPSDMPDVGQVTGKVTVDGKALTNAIVNFTPKAGGRPSTGVIDDSGNYELLYTASEPGAMIGEHTVTLELIEEDDADGDEEEGDEGAATGLPKAATDGSLVKDVVAGSQEINIEL